MHLHDILKITFQDKQREISSLVDSYSQYRAQREEVTHTCRSPHLNLSYDWGGPYVPPQSVFIFLLQLSPPSLSLRPFCIFLPLVMRGGGRYVPPQSVFIFLPKISPPDQTLRPTCKFLILGLLHHDFFFLLKIQ